MALRRACAQSMLLAPTHALVTFVEEGTTSVVPLKRITFPSRKELAQGVHCEVEWSRGHLYPAAVIAIGKPSCLLTVRYIVIVFVGMKGEVDAALKIHVQEEAEKENIKQAVKKPKEKENKKRKKRPSKKKADQSTKVF